MTREVDILVSGMTLPVSCVLPGCYNKSLQFVFSLSAWPNKPALCERKKEVKDPYTQWTETYKQRAMPKNNNEWRGTLKGHFYTWRLVYLSWRVLLNLWKQLRNVFCGSERSFIKSEKMKKNPWWVISTVNLRHRVWKMWAFTRQEECNKILLICIMGNVGSSVFGGWPILGPPSIMAIFHR